MSRTILSFMLLALAFAPLMGQDEDEDSCYGCHLELDPPFAAPAELFEGDAHARNGLSCTACHGGDNEAWDYDKAKAPSTGFIGKPVGKQIVELCGDCHSSAIKMRRYNPSLATDQESKYWISGHGLSMAAGKLGAAECASCHGAHGVKSANDPTSPVYHANVATTCGKCHASNDLMAASDLPSDIVAHYKGSIHGEAVNRGDTGAPTCNTCHGNHGAAPPEVGSIQEVCGLCHPNNQRLFNQTKMRNIFSDRGLHGCVVCHTAHDIQKVSDTMVSFDQGGVCAKCHESDAPGSDKVVQIRAVLDSLNVALEMAQSALHDAESRGLEVEPIYLDFQTARTALVQSRTQVHTFDPASVAAEAEAGFTISAAITDKVALLIHDFKMRKVGLGIATLMISFLAIVLYLYIKTLEES